jgi:cytochrome c biogenesis protein CcdA
MERSSILEYSLFMLGIILVIISSFNDGNVPPSGFWERYGAYILIIGGLLLILIAVVLRLGKRK